MTPEDRHPKQFSDIYMHTHVHEFTRVYLFTHKDSERDNMWLKMTDLKNSIEILNSRIDSPEEKISKLEDGTI